MRSDSHHWPGHADKDTRCDGGPGEAGHNQRWRLGALHDVQHPAQNTRPAPGCGQTLAAISMGREGDWRDTSQQMSRRAERERETAQRHCYTLETHSDWDVTPGLIGAMSVWSLMFADSNVGV